MWRLPAKNGGGIRRAAQGNPWAADLNVHIQFGKIGILNGTLKTVSINSRAWTMCVLDHKFKLCQIYVQRKGPNHHARLGSMSALAFTIICGTVSPLTVIVIRSVRNKRFCHIYIISMHINPHIPVTGHTNFVRIVDRRATTLQSRIMQF